MPQDRKIYITPSQDGAQDTEIGDFRGFAKQRVSLADPILEIGPSYMPLFLKKEGYTVSIVDHADADALRVKYAANSNQIEDVDYVWQSGTLDELIKQKFSYVYASHVIEHSTDFIRFLSGVKNLLSDDGRLILIVPDKRYCFDIFQQVTDTAKIISDYQANTSRHTIEAIYREQAQVMATYEGVNRIAWWQGEVSEIGMLRADPVPGLQKALKKAECYVDAHEYFFTPSSFLLLIEEARFHGLVDLEIELLTRSRGCEFLVILKPSPSDQADANPERIVKLKRELSLNIMREHQESWEQLTPLRSPIDAFLV